MTHILHRHCRESLPTVDTGEGVYLIDTKGKRYLDACGGAAVSCLGHNHPDVISAIQRQAERIPFAHTGFFTSQPAEQLADKLIELSPASLSHAYFVSGGSEAVESALKLARQYWIEREQPKRTHFIGRRQSYHGNTLGALGVGGNQWRRATFAPLLAPSSFIDPCYFYRNAMPEETRIEYGERAAQALEEEILRLGPESVVGFVAETFVGATAGVLPPENGYFRRVREICDHYDILLILDEVMCGTGRTGTFFAFEQEGIVPDIVALAKGLAAGYQPIGAVLLNKHIYHAINDGSGFFQHGHTFLAHPIACAAANATLDVLASGLLDEVSDKGKSFYQRLVEAFGDHQHVGDIRGRGLFWGLELVADKASKMPFKPATQLHKRIKHIAMQQGLMCYPMAGTIDGQQGHHILLAPPFIINEEEIQHLAERLTRSVNEAIASVSL
ncbi:aspartate aminotransferase family protein [Veronia pacifica]|uniref:Adenosylmethionine-8-amino-7-oxononanoate aminotransferase n=1 Tax=Veronia pacifica TaxID=1080227 RepID=A0A1C3EI67_9GAMM|nr:aspartate aminotransferase family protein [Veronia pacifica]ODA32909.1 adenosylmethionine-8-amino-7-oxononanoate aminotransferase [Veronia pacifica]